MTRGNQREIDRQRALNRHGPAVTVKTGKPSRPATVPSRLGDWRLLLGDPRARREADAKALQEKVAAKRVSAEGAAASAGGGRPELRKK